MIRRLSTKCRITEMSAVCTDLLTVFNKQTWENDAYMTEMLKTLTAEDQALLQAIKRGKIESELDEKDQVRDECVRTLYFILLGASHNPECDVLK